MHPAPRGNLENLVTREKPSFNTSSPFARWSRWHVNTFLSLIRDALNNHRTQFHQTHATSFRARSMNLVLTACSATGADCLASLWVKIVAPSWNGNVLSPPIVPLAFVSSTTPCLRVLACQVAALVISHNLTKPPASASRRFTLRSWNITSLSDLDTLQARRKIDLLQRVSSNSIIALQETGWVTTQPRALMQILGTNEIAASPAINTEGGRRSGGVAIILPTYAFGRKLFIYTGGFLGCNKTARWHATVLCGLSTTRLLRPCRLHREQLASVALSSYVGATRLEQVAHLICRVTCRRIMTFTAGLRSFSRFSVI